MSEKTNQEYNTKSDFVNLAIIIILITIVLAILYYYDKQSDILKTTAERVMELF